MPRRAHGSDQHPSREGHRLPSGPLAHKVPACIADARSQPALRGSQPARPRPANGVPHRHGFGLHHADGQGFGLASHYHARHLHVASFRLAITEREAQGIESQSRTGGKRRKWGTRMLVNHMHGNIVLIMFVFCISLIVCNTKLTS